MLKKIILFPFGGNAREAAVIIKQMNDAHKEWEILGFLDDDKRAWGKDYLGIKVLGGKEVLNQHPDARILAVPGNPAQYLQRKGIIDGLAVEESRFTQAIHPSAIISSDSKVGINSLIMANVVVTSHVTIGDHCIILPNTTVSHDSVVGNCCCIDSNVSISGGVRIGENSYIGSGSRIREQIQIDANTLVGLGSNVVSNIGKEIIVVGNPAKLLNRE